MGKKNRRPTYLEDWRPYIHDPKKHRGPYRILASNYDGNGVLNRGDIYPKGYVFSEDKDPNRPVLRQVHDEDGKIIVVFK